MSEFRLVDAMADKVRRHDKALAAQERVEVFDGAVIIGRSDAGEPLNGPGIYKDIPITFIIENVGNAIRHESNAFRLLFDGVYLISYGVYINLYMNPASIGAYFRVGPPDTWVSYRNMGRIDFSGNGGVIPPPGWPDLCYYTLSNVYKLNKGQLLVPVLMTNVSYINLVHLYVSIALLGKI